MSASHATATATSSLHSRPLPSFKSSFHPRSFSNLATNAPALPPIQTLSPAPDRPTLARSRSPSGSAQNTRKRPREDDKRPDNAPRQPSSPQPDRIKQEPDELAEDPPSALPPSAQPPASIHEPVPVPSTASGQQTKKRRVLALNTDVRPGSSDPAGGSTTPISPVVMGFTIDHKDPNKLEQVRSMINVKNKQKALIEQRRGSAPGLTPIQGPSSSSLSLPTVTDVGAGRSPPMTHGARPRGLAKTGSSSGAGNAGTAPAHAGPSSVRPPSPPAMIGPGQRPSQTTLPSTLTLPPQPGGFGQRRGKQTSTGGRRKPADLMISPRDAHAPGDLAPVIQSAPAVPRQGASHFPGRFNVVSPRTSSLAPSGSTQRIAISRVPPTPTSLTLRGSTMVAAAPSGSSSVGPLGRSPPTARTVPIAAAHVPPTPGILRNPGYVGEKAAFLAPFETFYEALADSKELKGWLADQLQKSNALVSSLQQQQERLQDTIEAAVDRRVGGMREEMYGLRRRVAELEDSLRVRSVDSGYDADLSRRMSRISDAPGPPVAYTFPPSERVQSMLPPINSRPLSPPRRLASPPPRRLEFADYHGVSSQTASPVPFEASRRHSVSSVRFEPRHTLQAVERESDWEGGRHAPATATMQPPDILEGPGQPARPRPLRHHSSGHLAGRERGARSPLRRADGSVSPPPPPPPVRRRTDERYRSRSPPFARSSPDR